VRPTADEAVRHGHGHPSDRASLTAQKLRRIFRLVGITPEIVENWSTEGVFPLPGTTAETVKRWISGSGPRPRTP
jgi:hypothetical protein